MLAEHSLCPITAKQELQKVTKHFVKQTKGIWLEMAKQYSQPELHQSVYFRRAGWKW